MFVLSFSTVYILAQAKLQSIALGLGLGELPMLSYWD